MKEITVYIAELGKGQADVILREPETSTFYNSLTIVGTEVFGSPFDALVELNSMRGIKPEEDITIYQTKVLDRDLLRVHVGETKNTHIFSTIPLVLDKKCTMALGSLVQYLHK